MVLARLFLLFALLSAGASAQQASEVASESYVIRPLDSFTFRIQGEAETQLNGRVSVDGRVVVPYLNAVEVAGKTVAEARALLYELYDRDYYVNPQVIFSVIVTSGRRVQVLGQVNRPGFVQIPPEEQLSLVQAIAAAGDFTRLADRGKIEWSRIGEDGRAVTTRLDFDQELRRTEPLQLRDGDTLRVPERVF